MRHVSRVLVGLLATALIASGSAGVAASAAASSPIEPSSGGGAAQGRKSATGEAYAQPPTGTVKGKAAPVEPVPQTELPLPLDVPQPLDLKDVPNPPEVIGGYDPGTSVELPTLRTVDTAVFANANGTRTVFAYTGPVHYRDALGLWQKVDQNLVQAADGSYQPRGVGVGLSLAANATGSPLAKLTVDSTHSVGYRLDSAVSANAWVSGAMARYTNVRPGTDLELVALANGVKETIVLKSRSAPRTFTFPLTLQGVTASVDSDGDVVYRDSGGKEWARTPRGSMYDSLINGDTGEGAYSDGVSYTLVPFGGGTALRVTVDSTWLDDPARVFPVRVDPTTKTVLTDADDTYVQTGYTANNSTEPEIKIGTPTTTPNTTYSYLHFAGINSTYTNYYVTGADLALYETHAWTCTPKSWTVHNVTSAWSGSTIKASAQPSFNATPIVTTSSAKGDTCGGAGWNTPTITSAVQNWTHGTPNYGLTVRPGSATDRNFWKRFASHQGDPTNHTSAPRVTFSYSTEGAKYDLDKWITNPTNTTNGKFRIKLTNWGHDPWTAGGAYKLGYHLYDSAGNLVNQNGTRTAMPTTVNPRGSITLDATIGKVPPGNYIVVFDMVHEGVAYFSSRGVPVPSGVAMAVSNQAPAISKVNSPGDLAAVTTNRPTFSVTGADTDAYPASGTLSYYFRICENPDAETPAATCVNSGWISSSAWTAPANRLFYRRTYYWHAYIKDSGGAQRNPNWVYRFTPVVSDTSAGAHFGADPYGIDSGGVNVSTSSFTTSAVEAPVATIGPPLSVTRTYNSGDTKIGAFGQGWSTLYDMSATADASGNVTVIHADGRKALYGKNPDGTFAASYGYYSTLAAVSGGGWTLTDKGANTYTFNTGGRLTTVNDPAGRQLTLADNGAGVTTVTDTASGRTLTLVRTGSLVTSVRTQTVGAIGKALEWRYYYTGSQLRAVCDPRDNADGGSCVSYENAGPGGRLSKITMPRGNTPVSLTYHTDGTVLSRTDGNGKTWTYLSVDVATDLDTGGWEHRLTVQDPKNHNTEYVYDGLTGRLIRRTDPAGKVQTYGYDTTTGFLTKITDENGNTVTLTVDDRGNITSRSVPYGDVAGLVATSYYDYIYEPGSPRDNKINVFRDARSANANDATYAVSYVYSDSTGQITTVSTPATAAFPSGTTATWAYTNGSEAAVGSTGTQPAGLLATETDPRGNTTSYSYNSSGDLTRVVDRSGLRTDYGYDELGRLATTTAFPTNHPSGVTTTYTYDLSGIVGQVDGPPVLNQRTNQTHQLRTVNTPDANGIIRDVTVSDVRGFDAPRVTHYDYDNNDQLTLVRDPEGGTTTRTYDDAENVATVTDPRGLTTQFDYDVNDQLTTVTAKGFIDDPITPGAPRDVVLARYTYDAAGWLDTATDARGVVRDYTWNPDQRLRSVTVKGYRNTDGTTRDIVTEWHQYDPAGNETVTKLGGYLRTVNSTYDAAGWLSSQVDDAATINRTTSYVRDQAGNVVTRRLSDATRTEETRYGYGPSGLVTSITVENGATDLTTTIERDNRGLMIGRTDPRGNTVTPPDPTFKEFWNYDAVGQLQQYTARTTTNETQAGTAGTRRLEYFGYNTFGEQTEHDTRGFGQGRITSTYDRAGRLTGRAYPSYTPPGGTALNPTESFGYNPAGDLTSQIDRRGNTTTFDVDLRGRLVRRTQPKPDPAQPNPVARWSYDDQGNLTAAVDATGARTEYGYDDLDRLRHHVSVVRNGTPTPSRYTTTFDYDDLGNSNKRVSPRGETGYANHNAVSELIQLQDDAGHLWKTGRDVAGREIKHTDPLGRYQSTIFDLAGRATTRQAYSPTNVLLRTENATYDLAGNLTSYTPSASGPGQTSPATRTYTWDRENRLLSLVEPTTGTQTITTTFGYDTWGNRTRTTDGNNRTTWTAYNPWDLPETVTEPVTAAYPAVADRTWTTSYDGGGLPVKVDKPGGVSVARSFDTLGRLTAETGTGAPGTRALGYDLAGRLISAGHPSGNQTFGYDDRGLLTSSTGPAGNATLGYDEDGRLTSRTDPVGTTSFTYDPRDLPATITDPITGRTQTLTYFNDGQLKTRQYGSGGATRSYTYDNQGRLATDTVNAPSTGAVTTATSYGYDSVGNVASQTISPAGISGAGTHTYGYDLADRLTSWTGPAGTKTYGYDNAGNRTTAAGKTYTYDERNRLVSDSAGGTYTYTARGTLASAPVAGSQGTLTADAFGRILTDSGTTFSYDSLDRVATRGPNSYSYDGVDPEPVVVGITKSARGPGGELLSTNIGTGGSAIITNGHGDTTAYLNPATGAVNGSHSYDPFGVQSTTGSSGFGGFQGQQTSPAQRVYMQSRWYDPATGTFAGRDTLPMSGLSGGGANRYAYGLGNPVTLNDPTGHCPPAACLTGGAAAVGTGAAVVTAPAWAIPVAVGVGVVGLAAGGWWLGNKIRDQIYGDEAASSSSSKITFGTSSARYYDTLRYPTPQYYTDAWYNHDWTRPPGPGYPPAPGQPRCKTCGDEQIIPKPKPPRIFIAGPVPPGAGTFKPIIIDPLENVLTLAAAPAPAPAPVTGTTADDKKGCGKGGTANSCTPKQSSLTRGCDLDGASTMRPCEPVVPQAGAHRGGNNGGPAVGTAQGGCDDIAGIFDPDCAPKSTVDDYLDLVEYLDVSTGPNEAVFYSGPGNRALAEAFAKQNGKSTLEMTNGGRWLDAQRLFEPNQLTTEEALQVWSRLSERFAAGSSGSVTGFVDGAKATGIFNTVEYPTLLSNPNVTNVITGGL
ncbi:MAG TPA: RHS repeat-associated core domain-containing protein [Frankiaceae bacterium]|nr:RHS repeat-associated core domain-containing protein [Frankiaceae bacterium]